VLPLDKVHGAPTRVGLPPPSPQLPLSVGPLSVGPLSVGPLSVTPLGDPSRCSGGGADLIRRSATRDLLIRDLLIDNV
jgi:hypothetical protein